MINIGDIYESGVGNELEITSRTPNGDWIYRWFKLNGNPTGALGLSCKTDAEFQQAINMGTYKLIQSGVTSTAVNVNFIQGSNWTDTLSLGPTDGSTSVKLNTHQNHEVVTNTVYGKTFNYCRDCKVEV